MSQIDVNKIIESVLTETKSTKVDLLADANERLQLSVDEYKNRPEEEKNIPPYVPMVAEAFTFAIDREIEIYKNVEIALQRVIDEMDAVKR